MQPRRIGQIFSALALAAMLGTGLPGCSSTKTQAEEKFARGQQYVAQNDMWMAGVELRSAVKLRDDNAEMWLLLGQVEQKLGNLREAYIAYTRADELQPGNADTLRALSYAGYVVGASREAGQAADNLLSLAPGDSSGLIIKGLIALDEGDTAAALKIADSMLAANAGDQTGIMLKARATAIKGDIAGAQKLVTDTMAGSADSGGLLTLVLQIQRLAGDAPGLGETFSRLLKLDRDSADLYVDYANFLYKTGKPDAARRLLADRLLKEQRNGPYIAWAFSLLDRYEPRNAPPVIDPRLRQTPPSTLRTVTARYLLDRGDARGAAALLERGGVAAADRGLYARALDLLNRRSEAEAIVQTLLDDTQSQDADALMLRARWAIASRSFERALSDAQAAVIADPPNVEARLVLVDAYRASGAASRARQILAQALIDLPRSSRLRDALLDFLQKSGDKAGQLDAVRAFADANAADPGSWDMLAKVCTEQGNTACAATARLRMRDAEANFDMPNPDRPNLQRGLFSPLKRKQVT